MAVTVVDIAERAGVSRAAVSKALNDKSDISAGLKRKIRRIADEMGYTVNIAAKTLSTRKTSTVGVSLAFPQIPTVAERILGIQDCVLRSGYLSMISFHGGDLESEISQLRMLRGRVDGVIVTPINQDKKLADCLAELGVPVVLMNETLAGVEADYVGDDDDEGGYVGAAHLLDSTKGPLCYFGNRADCPSDNAITRGVRRALEEKGVKGGFVSLWDNTDRERVDKNVGILLSEHPEVKGVFAFSDMTALWVMESLLNRGVAIPSRMKIMGYDNIDFASMARIPLTSISQPNRQIGAQAAALLLEKLKDSNSGLPPRKIVFPPRLIVRDSTR
jgi:LacI family transcriptional regulator